MPGLTRQQIQATVTEFSTPPDTQDKWLNSIDNPNSPLFKKMLNMRIQAEVEEAKFFMQLTVLWDELFLLDQKEREQLIREQIQAYLRAEKALLDEFIREREHIKKIDKPELAESEIDILKELEEEYSQKVDALKAEISQLENKYIPQLEQDIETVSQRFRARNQLKEEQLKEIITSNELSLHDANHNAIKMTPERIDQIVKDAIPPSPADIIKYNPGRVAEHQRLEKEQEDLQQQNINVADINQVELDRGNFVANLKILFRIAEIAHEESPDAEKNVSVNLSPKEVKNIANNNPTLWSAITKLQKLTSSDGSDDLKDTSQLFKAAAELYKAKDDLVAKNEKLTAFEQILTNVKDQLKLQENKGTPRPSDSEAG